jgi:ABC-type anion transport system duplicated permease subunit
MTPEKQDKLINIGIWVAKCKGYSISDHKREFAPRCLPQVSKNGAFPGQFVLPVKSLLSNRIGWLWLWCLTPLSTIQYFSYIVAVSFIGEENRSTRKKHLPAASHWQSLSHNVVSSTSRLSGIRTLVVIGTDCICSCKSNYNTIMVMTAPQ